MFVTFSSFIMQMWNFSSLKSAMMNGESAPRSEWRPIGFFLKSNHFTKRILAYIAVDGGFPLNWYSLKPYPGPQKCFGCTTPIQYYLFAGSNLSIGEQLFNRILCSSRQFVEQMWGMLANRFRTWRAPNEFRGKDWIGRVTNAIIASMIIHNLCVDDSDWWKEDDDYDEDPRKPLFFDAPNDLFPDLKNVSYIFTLSFGFIKYY
jgi:hypothetical protein